MNLDVSARPPLRPFAFAISAYVIWGLFPLYWKLLKGVAPVDIFCHRIVWSAVFFILLLSILKIFRANSSPRINKNSLVRNIPLLALSAGLISINWLTYIYGVNSGHVLETSLGYFINPLVSVFLGMVFLRERLRRAQWFAVALAAIGVLQLAMQSEHFPYFALLLGFSFGSYGLVRKITPVEPLIASTTESTLLAFPALALLVYLGTHDFASQNVLFSTVREYTFSVKALLITGGAVTGIPLLLFTAATRKLPLSTMGFILYLTPSIQFFLAVLLYHEPFTSLHARSFGCIWTALAIYTIDLTQHRRRIVNRTGSA